MSFLAMRANDPAWSPTSQQSSQRDTTLLLDPAGDATAGRTPGYGGLLPSTIPPSTVAGKFLQGYNPTATTKSYRSMPVDGLLSIDQFTVEFFASLTLDWANGLHLPLLTLGEASNALSVVVGNNSTGHVDVLYSHQQNPASPSSYSANISDAISVGTYLANTWVSVAVTLKNGTLTLWLNGVNVKQTTSVVSPVVWGATESAEGLLLPASTSNACDPSVTVSDVRISRQARDTVAAILSQQRSVVTVGSTTGATIQPLLAGGLHGLPTSSADTQAASLAGTKLVRQDKLNLITPVGTSATATTPTAGQSGAFWYDWTAVDVALSYIYGTLGCQLYLGIGGCPQNLGGATAPWSGAQLTQNICKSTFTVDPSVPSNATQFGQQAADLVYHIVTEKGYTLPYVGLWNEPDGSGNWSGTVPQYQALYNAFATAIRAVAPAVKLGCPEVSNWAQAKTTWIKAMIDYCATNSLPLDFISWHFYSGDLSEMAQVQAQVAAWASADSIATPALICGEWSWCFGVQTQNPWYAPGGASNTNTLETVVITGEPTGGTFTLAYGGQTTSTLAWNASPNTVSTALQALSSIGSGNVSVVGQARNYIVTFQGALAGGGRALMTGDASGLTGGTAPALTVAYTAALDYLRNDWAAAWTASSLIQMQKQGVVVSVQCNPSNTAPNNCDQFFDSSSSLVQPSYNVMQLWSKMGGFSVLSTTKSPAADPGLHAVAAKDAGTGKVYILLASLHYRKVSDSPVLVNLAGAGVADGTAVTLYLVDDAHSNAWDAGTGNASLQTGTPSVSTRGTGAVDGGSVGVNLRPLAAALLVVG